MFKGLKHEVNTCQKGSLQVEIQLQPALTLLFQNDLYLPIVMTSDCSCMPQNGRPLVMFVFKGVSLELFTLSIHIAWIQA